MINIIPIEREYSCGKAPGSWTPLTAWIRSAFAVRQVGRDFLKELTKSEPHGFGARPSCGAASPMTIAAKNPVAVTVSDV
jgi:hypothetical protein